MGTKVRRGQVNTPAKKRYSGPKIIKRGLPDIDIPDWPVGVVMTCKICGCMWELRARDTFWVANAWSRRKAHKLHANCPRCEWGNTRKFVVNQEK